MQHMRDSLPPPLSLPHAGGSERVVAVSSATDCTHTFATLIKRSGLCHTWHAADNSRASVQLQFRLLPASACGLCAVSCLPVCLHPACLQPSSCVLPPASCDLCTKQRCLVCPALRPSRCAKNAALSALSLLPLLLRRHVWHVAATRDAH